MAFPILLTGKLTVSCKLIQNAHILFVECNFNTCTTVHMYYIISYMCAYEYDAYC